MNNYFEFVERNIRYLSESQRDMWYRYVIPALTGEYGERNKAYKIAENFAHIINEHKENYWEERNSRATYSKKTKRKVTVNANGEAVELDLEVEEPKKDFTKVVVKEPVVLKSKVNFSTSQGNMSHPIRDELFAQSKNSIRRYEELIFEHVQKLEDEFPKYEDFYYEFESDGSGSWYNLMGKGK